MVVNTADRSEALENQLRSVRRQLTGSMGTLRTTPAPALSGPRMPPMPSWWIDDDEATRSSMTAAQQMNRS